MNAEQVSAKLFSIVDSKWCLEHIPSSALLSKKEFLSKSEILTIKQDFETFFVQYRTFDDQSEKMVSGLKEIIKELSDIANSSRIEEQIEIESEPQKSFNVCSSSVFKKDGISPESNWSPSNIVGLDFSFTKSYQISPDVRKGSDEDGAAALSLIYKWKGLKSNVQPLSIPISNKELNEYLLGAIVMFSIFDPKDRGFPVLPKDPETCKQLLEAVNDWTVIGQSILESFEVTPVIIGALLQKHLMDIAHSSLKVQPDAESMKAVKKKKAEEYMTDIWTKRKKAYLKNLEKSSE